MHLSYDYTELMQEFTRLLHKGTLRQDSHIYIIRQRLPVYGNYYPIIDWYYMSDLQYTAITDSRFYPIKIQVGAVIAEMEQWGTV